MKSISTELISVPNINRIDISPQYQQNRYQSPISTKIDININKIYMNINNDIPQKQLYQQRYNLQ